jgi:hypothetical protein
VTSKKSSVVPIDIALKKHTFVEQNNDGAFDNMKEAFHLIFRSKTVPKSHPKPVPITHAPNPAKKLSALDAGMAQCNAVKRGRMKPPIIAPTSGQVRINGIPSGLRL